MFNGLTLYTDGACSGNPGPGGWSSILILNGTTKELSGYSLDTTNNRMEMMGVIEGLKFLKDVQDLTVVTDSRYICDAFLQNWITNWIRNDWETSKGGAVKNKDLWHILIDLNEHHNITWSWIKGHDSDPYNIRADYLACLERDRAKSLV